MSVEFLYFDLGKVLVNFDHNQMFRQMAAVAGTEPDRVKEVVFTSGLYASYETGEISASEFHATFCEKSGTSPNAAEFVAAFSNIFTLNLDVMPILSSLWMTNAPIGILSNTCAPHWEWCAKHFEILDRSFPVKALSYELRAAKPDSALYQQAAQLADTSPESIFFVDDLAPNVQGALDAGFNAVQYTTPAKLVDDLRERGVVLNV